MRLLDRIALLIKADAHGVVESIEDRRLLAKQFIREAKLALDGKRAHIAALRSDQHRLTSEAKRLSTLIATLDKDVEMALANGEDDLARAAVRKLLPVREADRRLSARLVALREEELRLSETVAVQEQEFEILKSRLQAELATAEVGGDCEDAFQCPIVTEDDVDLELLRRRRASASSRDETLGRGAE